MYFQDFNDCYKSLCATLLCNHVMIGNTREIENCQFTIGDINTCTSTIRRMPLHYVCGELLWYVRGSNSTEFISKFGAMWKRLSDDGLTNNSAYGWVIRYKYGFDQLEKIIELLRKDPLSRRAVININVPNQNVIETHDEPCTIALQFLIRDNRVNCTAIMRSNDIWFGLPYDIVFFTTLQKYVADALGYEYGSYTHFATSLHMYERDKEKITQLFNNPIQYCKINHRLLFAEADELYNILEKSTDPKQDIVNIFTERGILET